MLARLRRLLLENRTTKQTIVKNVAWLSVSQAGSRLIRAAIIVYAARLLGAAEYGVFSYALGLAAFFTIFADIGVSQILTRQAAQQPEERSVYFATSLWIKLALLLGTGLIVIFVAPVFSRVPGAVALLPLVALLTVFDGIREFSLSFLRALERMEIEAFVVVLMNVAIVVAGFIALSIAASAYSITLSYVASTALGAVAVVIILRVQFQKVFSHFRRDLVRPIVTAALPFAILGVLGAFMLNTDLVMLGWWRSAAEIGYYSAAQKVIQVLYTLPAILASAMFPALSRLVAQGNHDRVRALMERMMTAVLFIALPATVGGIILAKPLMVFLYGSAYAPAAGAFQFLSITLLLIFPGVLLGNLVLAYDKQRRIGWYVAAGSLGNVVMNALLIPPFGIAGCAVATIVAQALNNGFMWRMIKRSNDFRTLRYLTRIIPASLLMGMVAWSLMAVGVHVLLTITAAAAAYVGFLVLFREPFFGQLASLRHSLGGTETS